MTKLTDDQRKLRIIDSKNRIKASQLAQKKLAQLNVVARAEALQRKAQLKLEKLQKKREALQQAIGTPQAATEKRRQRKLAYERKKEAYNKQVTAKMAHFKALMAKKEDALRGTRNDAAVLDESIKSEQ